MQDDYYLCGNGEWVEYVNNFDPSTVTWSTILRQTFSGDTVYCSVSWTKNDYNDKYTGIVSSGGTSSTSGTCTFTLEETDANKAYVGHYYNITTSGCTVWRLNGELRTDVSGKITSLPFSVSVEYFGSDTISAGTVVGNSSTGSGSYSFSATLYVLFQSYV